MNRTKLKQSDASVRNFFYLVSVICSIIILSGCQSYLRPNQGVEYPEGPERLSTLGDEFKDSEIQIESLQESRSFSVRSMRTSDPLPDDGRVMTISMSYAGYMDALRIMLAPYSIGLMVDGNPKLADKYAHIVTVKLTGTLPQLIDRISESIGFFYTYRNNLLTIVPEETFVLELPPALAEDTTAGLTNTMQYLGASDIYLDRLNRTVSYKTNRNGAKNIEQYLAYLRKTRSILLYEIHVYQVTLSESKSNGIRWDSLIWQASQRPAQFLVSGASNEVGNIVISGDKFNLNTFVAFLNSQGTARLISQPRMALLSGTKGSLRVGENTTIVSKVGTVLGGVSGSLTTVETSQVKTGFDLALFGEVHEGSIYTKISLSLSDLVKIEDKTAGTTTITLPTVAERNVNSIMRARAGDVVILGGISARRDNGDVINSIGQSSKNESNNRSELVIALRPRILHFSSNGVNDVGKTDTLLPAELVRPSIIKEYSDNQNISKD